MCIVKYWSLGKVTLQGQFSDKSQVLVFNCFNGRQLTSMLKDFHLKLFMGKNDTDSVSKQIVRIYV